MISRELTESERAATDAAWEEYCQACHVATNVSGIGAAWDRYHAALDALGVYPSLSGYLVRRLEEAAR